MLMRALHREIPETASFKKDLHSSAKHAESCSRSTSARYGTAFIEVPCMEASERSSGEDAQEAMLFMLSAREPHRSLQVLRSAGSIAERRRRS